MFGLAEFFFFLLLFYLVFFSVLVFDDVSYISKFCKG